MRRLYVLLPILATLLAGSVVFAQESPFGNLNTPETKLRFFDSVDNINIDTYLSAKENYENLLELHERAFGTRKVELEEQILARAKDLVYAKLGAVKTQLYDVTSHVENDSLISEPALNALKDATSTYVDTIPGYLEQVEEQETVEDIIEVSKVANFDAEAAIDALVPALALLTVSRGEEIIADVELKAPVIQEHLNESSALGGNTGDVQEEFEDAMLELEDARDKFNAIKAIVKDGTGIGAQRTMLNETKQLLGESTLDMTKAADGLNGVIDSLRTLYGQSPWLIDVNKFTPEGNLIEEVMEEGEGEESEDSMMMEEETSEGATQ